MTFEGGTDGGRGQLQSATVKPLCIHVESREVTMVGGERGPRLLFLRTRSRYAARRALIPSCGPLPPPPRGREPEGPYVLPAHRDRQSSVLNIYVLPLDTLPRRARYFTEISKSRGKKWVPRTQRMERGKGASSAGISRANSCTRERSCMPDGPTPTP